MPNESFWLQLLTDKGLAVFLVGVVLFAIWRVSRFLGPHIATIVSGHSSLMYTLQETSIKQTAMLNAIQDDHGSKLSEIKEMVQSKSCQFHPHDGG